jgi:hypothetical protein
MEDSPQLAAGFFNLQKRFKSFPRKRFVGETEDIEKGQGFGMENPC